MKKTVTLLLALVLAMVAIAPTLVIAADRLPELSLPVFRSGGTKSGDISSNISLEIRQSPEENLIICELVATDFTPASHPPTSPSPLTRKFSHTITPKGSS